MKVTISGITITNSVGDVVEDYQTRTLETNDVKGIITNATGHDMVAKEVFRRYDSNGCIYNSEDKSYWCLGD